MENNNFDPKKPEKPVALDSNEQLELYFNYLKDIDIITEQDVQILYYLMKDPRKLDLDKVKALFTLLEQSRGAEKFENMSLANECIGMIEVYRTELDL
jgi:hypothetical protein